MLGVLLSRTELGSKLLTRTLMASGYVIVFFGLFNWFGQKEAIFKWVSWFSAPMQSLNFYQDAVMTDANGVRLTSVFQYANTYAAFLIAVLLACIFLAIQSSKRLSSAVHGFMAVPIIVSFFLTLSRGGLVVLPVVLLLVLPFLKPFRQISYLLQLAVSFVISLVILGKVTNAGIELSKQFNSSTSFQGWMTLLVASIINAAIAVLIQKYIAPWLAEKLQKFDKYRMVQMLIPVGSIVIGTIGVLLLFSDTGITKMLPENVRTRIENINFQQHSVLERGTFYSDALKLVRDYPVLGAGGGAWKALYEKYQNNPYVSREAHNFFLQYMVEVGIVGLAVLVLFLVLIFFLYIRNYVRRDDGTRSARFVFYIVVVSLLVHSTIDFNMSYVYIGMLVFICLGAMVGNLEKKLPGSAAEKLPVYMDKVIPTLFAVLSIVLFYNSVQALNGNSQFKTAVALAQAGKPYDQISAPLERSLQLAPLEPDYSAFKIDMMLQAYTQTKEERYYNEAVSLIKAVRVKEPFNRLIIEKEIQAYGVKDQLVNALKLVDNEILNFPWDSTLYEKSIAIKVDLGDRARRANDNKLRDDYWNDALKTYELVLQQMKHLETLPKEQLAGRSFGVTKDMSLKLGQIQYIQGSYEPSSNVMRLNLPEDLSDPNNRIMVRWYLAALQKQNKNDQPLYDKLIAADANERQEITNLVNAAF
jgi:O-antigen ligase